MNSPIIKGPDHHDFHDSSLIDFIVAPTLDSVKIVVSTPDEDAFEHLGLIQLDGVLRLEYESMGLRSFQSDDAPLEIYDTYYDYFSHERSRWIERFLLLGEPEEEAKRVFHIVLASSFVRGWGKHESLEGINIICRQVQINRHPMSTKVVVEDELLASNRLTD
jgi:hypothetical protein